MAIDNNTRQIRFTGVQSARESRNHHTDRQRRDTGTDPTVLSHQQRATTLIRRAKQTARLRIHEATAVRRLTTNERAGPGTGDRQGEVA